MKAPNFQILRASEADVPAIRELAGVIWRAHYPGIITSEQIEYMLARMYAPAVLCEEIRLLGICFELMRVEGQPAGFASYGPADEPGAMKLHKLYLHPQWHGRGLGSRLLQHCERAAQQAGASQLLLAVNKRNVKAIAAYERNGFVIAESTVTNIGGGFTMDDFVMTKRLPA